MKLGLRPSFKGQVHCSNIQVPKQEWFFIGNRAGPQAQLQEDKSNAPTSKSRNNNDFLLKNEAGPKAQLQKDKSNAPKSKSSNSADFLSNMKLGRKPSFTSPMLQHAQVQCSYIQVQKQYWFLIKNEAGPKAQLQKDKSNAPTSKSRDNNDFF